MIHFLVAEVTADTSRVFFPPSPVRMHPQTQKSTHGTPASPQRHANQLLASLTRRENGKFMCKSTWKIITFCSRVLVKNHHQDCFVGKRFLLYVLLVQHLTTKGLPVSSRGLLKKKCFALTIFRGGLEVCDFWNALILAPALGLREAGPARYPMFISCSCWS